MRHKTLLTSFLLIFFLSGCSVNDTPLSLIDYKTTISTKKVNAVVSKHFPLQKKSSFGSILFKRALLKPYNENDRIGLNVSFVLTSFEIPEGIEGVLALSAGLRYNPENNKIYLEDIVFEGANFSDVVLAKYVSKGARSALSVITMREFSGIEIYQVKKSFSVRFIKNVSVRKGKMVIRYGV